MFFKFLVDGSRAGSGNLEILVNGGRVTSAVRALGSQRFIASFTSHEPGKHTVQITFNGDTVQGKQFLRKRSLMQQLFKYFYAGKINIRIVIIHRKSTTSNLYVSSSVLFLP